MQRNPEIMCKSERQSFKSRTTTDPKLPTLACDYEAHYIYFFVYSVFHFIQKHQTEQREDTFFSLIPLFYKKNRLFQCVCEFQYVQYVLYPAIKDKLPDGLKGIVTPGFFFFCYLYLCHLHKWRLFMRLFLQVQFKRKCAMPLITPTSGALLSSAECAISFFSFLFISRSCTDAAGPFNFT